jgi:hypothetical protein
MKPVESTRAAERIPILGELHGEAMVYQPMAIKEISRGGAQIETSYVLQLNSLHEFRLTLGDRSVVLKARVVHSRISDVDSEGVSYRVGLEFVEMTERVAAVIEGFIDAIKAGRAGIDS